MFWARPASSLWEMAWYSPMIFCSGASGSGSGPTAGSSGCGSDGVAARASAACSLVTQSTGLPKAMQADTAREQSTTTGSAAQDAR